MKKLFTMLFLCASAATVFAQVGIGTNTPNSSSVLELSSTTKAFIPPRMTTSQRNQIAAPVAGMMIFNTTTDCVEIYRSAGWYSLCGGGGSNPTDSSSNDVAKSNLIAHWTFDDTKKEDSSNAVPETSTGTTAYVTGKIGKALQLTGSYMIYPVMPKLNNATALANGFTLSFWAQLPATSSFTSIFQLNGNIGDIFGLVQFAHRKNPDPAVPGSSGLDFDGALTHVNGTGTHSTGFDAMLEGSGFLSTPTEWIFVTMTYNDATRKITYYGNGTKLGDKAVATTVIPAAEKFELVTTNSNPGVSTSKVSFGALNTNPPFAVGPAPASWQGTSLTGTLDDVRLYDKALSDVEIQTLYTRGNAGK